ncbi:MAG: hypothetical protein RR356_07280 [Bacteroidales bacterium]
MKRIFYIAAFLFLFISCKNEQKNSSNSIKIRGKEQSELLYTYHKADSLYYIGIIDTNLFNLFIEQTLSFSGNFPEDPIAPDMLSKAGVATMILAKSSTNRKQSLEYAKKGLDIFNKIQKIYPEYESVKNCYINRAIIYDDIIGDYPSAEYEYRDFIHRYPNDTLTESIKNYLPFLGRSTDEIAEELKIN